MSSVLQYMVVAGGLRTVPSYNDGDQLGDGVAHHVYIHHSIPSGIVQETRYFICNIY